LGGVRADRFERTSASLLAGIGGVGDRMRSETSRRLESVYGAAPRSGRIETLERSEPLPLAFEFNDAAEQALEGWASAQRPGSGHLGEEKGQESIGSAARLTAASRVRTLSRSKALKSQAQACRWTLRTA
jgi:hypothetical protein